VEISKRFLAALDTRQGLSILALFQALNEDGRTVILVTHDDHVARHARRILKLKDGQLLSDKPVGRFRYCPFLLETEEALKGFVHTNAAAA
jgi:ABC-type lipoprotein export system ATPase subunit